MIELHRQDVVGKRVRRVLQSEWETFDDISACVVYVLLEDGTLFQLGSSDDGLDAGRLHASSVPVESLRPAEFVGAAMHCEGDTVLEVVASECWPTFGLLLSSNCFLSTARLGAKTRLPLPKATKLHEALNRGNSNLSPQAGRCFLYCDDSGGPGKVGACLTPVGWRYGSDDVVPLWILRATNQLPWDRSDT